MNIQSQIRHIFTGLAGLGTFIAAFLLLAPEQVQELNEAGAKLIEPLAVIASILAVVLVRALMAFASNFFGHGNGEGGSKPSGGMSLLFLAGTAAVLMGGLPSCSPAQMAAAREFPIRIGIQGDDAAVSYSTKGGLQVDAVIRSEK